MGKSCSPPQAEMQLSQGEGRREGLVGLVNGDVPGA